MTFGDRATFTDVATWSAHCDECNIDYDDNSAEFYNGSVFHECPKCHHVTESQE